MSTTGRVPAAARQRVPAAVSPLAFGASAIGNLYRQVSDANAVAAVRAAWDAGIRYFDTAPHYGLGLSERRLGAALRDYPRAEYVISTKVGRLLVDSGLETPGMDDEGFAVPATQRRVWDFSRDGVLRSLEGSLSRLGLDRVDIVYLHDPDDHWQAAVEQAFPTLAELRSQGVVTGIGAGMNQSAMLADFVRETDMDLVMLAGRYTLLDQSALDDLLPLCAQRSVGVVNVGVFNSGLLAQPRPAAGMKYDYKDASPALLARATALAEICQAHGVTLPAAALQFGRGHPAVVSTAMGAATAARVRQNVEQFSQSLPEALWDDLRSADLIRADAPLPGAEVS